MNVNLSSSLGGMSSSYGSSRTQRSQGPSQEEMAKIFAAMDSDGDGSVTQSEMEAARPPAPPEEFDMSSMSTSQFAGMSGMGGMGGAGGPPPGPPPGGGMGGPGGAGGQDPIQSLDSDEDGSVSSDEFGLDEASEEVQALFSAIDSDGDASLSSDEISSFRDQMKAQMESDMQAQMQTQGGERPHGPPPPRPPQDSESEATEGTSASTTGSVSSTSRTDAQEFIKMIAARYAQISGADSSTTASSSALSVSA